MQDSPGSALGPNDFFFGRRKPELLSSKPLGGATAHATALLVSLPRHDGKRWTKSSEDMYLLPRAHGGTRGLSRRSGPRCLADHAAERAATGVLLRGLGLLGLSKLQLVAMY